MRDNLELNEVNLREEPVENPENIGTVEWYHDPLRAAYDEVSEDKNSTTTDSERLKITVLLINCTIGPGLLPVLLEFWEIPRPEWKNTSPTQIEK